MKNLFLALFSIVLVAVLIYGIMLRKPHEQDGLPSITPMPLPKKTFHQSPEDYNRFAVESYLKIIRGKGDENAVFSPFSLSMALEVLYAGSHGDTTRSLENVLHLPKGKNDLPLHPALFEYKPPKKVTIDPMSYRIHPPIFLVGNSIWYSNKLTLNPTFEKNMKKAFFLETFPIDATVNPGQVAQDMEQWTHRVTQGLIPTINPEPPREASFTLLNTLYFKAFWQYQFETGNTHSNLPFTLATGEEIMAPRMSSEYHFPFMQNDELKALEMPYAQTYDEKSDFSMLFILPRATDGIHRLEEQLSTDMITGLVRELKDTQLYVSIPKFRLEQENDLWSLFDDKTLTLDADYSGMFTPSPVTDAVSAKQKIVLGIDEHGTEAAVATVIAYLSLGSEPPAFIVDHPFLFLIREQKSGAILFLGRVMNPNEK